MNEILLTCATMLKVGLMSAKEYNSILDNLFLETPEDTLLLDLEYASSDINETISMIQNYCAEHNIDAEHNINYDIFGRYLMDALKKAYYDYGPDIKGYASKVYALWRNLPSNIDLYEPFRTLNYADEPLFMGDEKQTREIYEEIFSYYDEQ